jgi:pyruvate dehydrogenase E1 component
MTHHDQLEIQEWLAALDAVIEREGVEQAKVILDQVLSKAAASGVPVASQLRTGYRDSFKASDSYPGDLALEAKIDAAVRWNSVVLVNRATQKTGGVGGHISSCNSVQTAYEIGLNHFFKGRKEGQLEDFVYFQGHSSESNYARSYLEGRLSAEQLDNFRQEIGGNGLSSYPHPWLMPNYWQFATVSLGLGQMQGTYAARFLRYLEHRGLADTKDRHVWVFCGDGEMDEPESRASLCFAANENLDNLTYIVNCNMQRLDGLVRSNFRIIDELEGLFKGCGWHVVKAAWNSAWDALFAKDHEGALRHALDQLVDGDLQNFIAHGGAYFREHFFNKDPKLAALVADMSDEQLSQLGFAAHDPIKVYSAFKEAKATKGKPSVILLLGTKGYGLGKPAESKNVAHNAIDMSFEDLKIFRDRFKLPLTDQQVENMDYYHPGDDSPEMQYMQERRQVLGGYLPARFNQSEKLSAPDLHTFDALLKSSGDRELSTTMALGRLISSLLKDPNIGARVVPIFSDEARTFGMEGLFRQVGIYSPIGQRYIPEDKQQLAYYKEAQNGQVLMEGITEAGCMASWIAAATSYSTNQVPMIPIFTYYSMFGFQREGDLIWAAADMRARGFLFGATAGRTTLRGEGLQHQDGNSLLTASSIPSCIAYDPAFAYELAVVVQNGLKRMYQDQEDVFFYVMVMNEKYAQPEMPTGVEEGILKGMYRIQQADAATITLWGSGAILRESLKAAELLKQDFGIQADVWSVTSYNELFRDAHKKQRTQQRTQQVEASYLSSCLAQMQGSIVAASDYIYAYPNQIREYIDKPFYILGTDGYGRSDTCAALRHFFEVDSVHIAYHAVLALVNEGKLSQQDLTNAKTKYRIDANKPNPATV